MRRFARLHIRNDGKGASRCTRLALVRTADPTNYKLVRWMSIIPRSGNDHAAKEGAIYDGPLGIGSG